MILTQVLQIRNCTFIVANLNKTEELVTRISQLVAQSNEFIVTCQHMMVTFLLVTRIEIWAGQ